MTEKKKDRAGLLLAVLAAAGLLFLAFVAGAWTAWRDVFPYRDHLRSAFIGAKALQSRIRTDRSRPKPRRSRKKVAARPSGVTFHDPARATPGLTLVLSGQNARLIDLDGTVRHAWQMEYEQVRGPGALIDAPADVSWLYWRPARVLPDGDLLAVVHLRHQTPEGLGLARLDRDSRVKWFFHGHVHHDLDVAPDGRIFILGQGLREKPPRGLERLRGPLVDERLFILSPEGALLEDIPLLEAFADSPYRTLAVRTAGERRYDKGDYLHSNSCEIADAGDAARFDFVREGQVLLSLREMSALAVLDPVSRRITWARLGPWFQQHDPDFLDNGNLLVFDNQGDWDRKGTTRVIEVDPRTNGIVWQYPPRGAPPEALWSVMRGEAQRFANGNTLINEQANGRIIEVTPAGEIVWEYLAATAPDPDDDDPVVRTMYTERFPPGTLDFPMNGGRL